ncbi:hypothetical protein Dsin_011706 [Dipteronia sinensis]|uniref:RNase H type-1 domain-containing protein n=1 Tax=Dipteronia sinensis TaxID=43782 RepID=A0AAE0AGQ0_9ROSI|nr:hypothetical protein Dsin_011706 [Dipteronia sinensis]
MDLKIGCVDTITKKKKVNIRWSPPVDGELKFNVDGSSRGNSGRACIGGILLNKDGDTLCIFISFLDCCLKLTSTAEVAAILKACQLCESVHCSIGLIVVIESDSKYVVSWVNGAGVGNIQLLDS